MNEKDLLEQIKHSAESVTPPDTLSPENVEQMLKDTPACDHPSKEGKQRTGRLSVYRLGSIAAVFALAILGTWAARTNITKSSLEEKDYSVAVSEEAQVEGTAAAEEFSAEDAVLTSAEKETEPVSAENLTRLDPAESYEAIYASLRDAFYREDDLVYAADDDLEYEMAEIEYEMEESADMAADMAPALGSSDSFSMDAGDAKIAVTQAQAAGTASHSETNVQELGVDEGDYVKTDGQFIYILKRSGSFLILSADGGELVLLVSIPLPMQETVKEMYVDGDLLSVITSGYRTTLDTSTEGVYSSVSKNCTSLYTYDIADREKPALKGSVTQDGSFSQSRKNGDYIYLFSSYSPTIQDTYETSSIVPETSRGKIAASEIYLPKHLNYSAYLVASSVNIHDPEQIVDQKAVVSVASTFYASQKNIYIANENWESGTTHTEFIKLHYDNGTIIGTTAGSVEGYLNNSFSLNEYKGYLRVVTTSYDEHYEEKNGLYVLDENLNLVGAITDLAPDETVRSARFFGDIGYFVTFRQTDPLFSVDLSDPANPRILGALKISGFSTYLHFYGEGLLLGLGYEADEQTGIRSGLKLSMFDVSDPANVTEIHRLVLKGITWCNSLDDYKSILIDPAKNLFGFTCDSRYLLFSYDPEKGFVKEFIYDFYNDLISESLNASQTGEVETSGTEETEEVEDTFRIEDFFGYTDYYDDDTTRGIYIDDTLYLVRPTAVTAFNMKDNYRETGRLFLG